MRFTIFTLLFALLPVSPCPAKTITLVADRWPPFNGVPGSGAEGYMVDIARKIFTKAGYTVEYTLVPWQRALNDTRTGLFNGVVGGSKTDARDFIFPKEELSRNLLSFYVRKGDPWKFTGPSSLTNRSIAVIKGYDYREWLNEYIMQHSGDSEKVQVITGDAPLSRNLQKLASGLVDVVVDSEPVILWEARQLGIMDKITPAGHGSIPSYCYIAFSPAHPDSARYAEILSEGIAELRASGKLQTVLDRYDLKDWKHLIPNGE